MKYQNMTAEQILTEVNEGARFVRYSYAVSILIMSFFRESNIYMVAGRESAVPRALQYSLITILAGWWGIPWGPIFSIKALFRNINGGRDVTDDVMRALR